MPRAAAQTPQSGADQREPEAQSAVKTSNITAGDKARNRHDRNDDDYRHLKKIRCLVPTVERGTIHRRDDT